MNQLSHFADDCRLIRQTSPIILNLTNYVAMAPTANALSAIGASPIMSLEPSEMEELVAISSAVVINIGCIEYGRLEAMNIAARTAFGSGKPWILDPVGAGASRLRTGTAIELAGKYHPAIIRANASEIMAIAGRTIRSRGVDSSESIENAKESADDLARSLGAAVSVSGPADYITDGVCNLKITNGHPLMPGVSAMGCTASAISGAFAAIEENRLQAAASAMALVGIAGEYAGRSCNGTGSFAVSFIDGLSTISPEEAANNIRYE